MAHDGVVLEVESVSKSFGALAALSKVSFAVRRGEIFSVIGPKVRIGPETRVGPHVVIDGDTFEVATFRADAPYVDVMAGEVLLIPGGVRHQAHAITDTLDLDVFTPPRQDWLDGSDAYLRAGKK